MTRYIGLALLATLLAALLGCGGAKKVAVKINQDIVTEDEFYQRVQDLDAVLLTTAARQGNLQKAGEVAMQAIITDALVRQAAKAKGITVKDQDVQAEVAFAKKYAKYSMLPRDPLMTDEDLKRDTRTQIAFRRLAALPLKLTQADYQTFYDAHKAEMVEPDQYKLRVIGTSTEKQAKAALDVLKKGVPFETVAIQYSEDPNVGRNSGDIGWVPNDPKSVPAKLLEAVQKLKPGEYTQSVVKDFMVRPDVPAGTPGVQPVPRFFVVRLEDKKVGRAPTLDEIRPYIEFAAVMEKDPGAVTRVQEGVRDLLVKATIQVNLKRYQPLISKLKAAAAQQGSQAPAAPAGAGPR